MTRGAVQKCCAKIHVFTTLKNVKSLGLVLSPHLEASKPQRSNLLYPVAEVSRDTVWSLLRVPNMLVRPGVPFATPSLRHAAFAVEALARFDTSGLIMFTSRSCFSAPHEQKNIVRKWYALYRAKSSHTISKSHFIFPGYAGHYKL